MSQSHRMIEVRPQPIGIFPFPATNLLLPMPKGEYATALKSLLAGDIEADLPCEWEFFRAAAQGETQSAMKMIRSDAEHSRESSAVSIFNLFVLNPSAASYDSAGQTLKGPLKELLDVAAYAAGIIDTIADNFTLDAELDAAALAASAAAAVESGDLKLALSTLQSAVAAAKESSPVLAATLISQSADLAIGVPGYSPALIMRDYKEAIRIAGDCKLPMLLPELHTKMGMVLQNASNGQRGMLLQAVVSYQAALQTGVTQEDHPELFAQLQNNLGLAYLSMPSMGSSDQLRNGIAVQSFRHALKVYTVDAYPDMWASVSMNLANALQYAPTSHPEENLVQAVETYEDILRVRTRAKDPVAYAIVLLNQANALAHLGIFKPSLEKLAEAYKLFQWYEQSEQAEAARELVEQINQQMGGQLPHAAPTIESGSN